MKAILSFMVVFLVGLRADEIQDRAAINKLIAALNNPVRRAGLFTKDADSDIDFDRLVELHQQNCSAASVMIGVDEPWTELTVPQVVSGRIRFVTANVAIVDGGSRVEGAVTLAHLVPLLFVVKKEGSEWRISAVRVLMPHAGVRQRTSP